jgi:hypothetical protein
MTPTRRRTIISVTKVRQLEKELQNPAKQKASVNCGASERNVDRTDNFRVQKEFNGVHYIKIELAFTIDASIRRNFTQWQIFSRTCSPDTGEGYRRRVRGSKESNTHICLSP